MMKSLEGLKKLEYFDIEGEENLWNARLLARYLTKTRKIPQDGNRFVFGKEWSYDSEEESSDEEW